MTSEVIDVAIDLPEQLSIAWRGGRREAPGLVVAPGLAITQAYGAADNPDPLPRRYALTYLASGRTCHNGSRCATHILRAAEVAASLGVDWTADKDWVVAALADKDWGPRLIEAAGRSCDHTCPGEPPIPPSWNVRCRTCDWQWEPYSDSESLTVEDAKRMARDHECEPWVEIAPPDGVGWVPPSLVGNDGTIKGLTLEPAQRTEP